MSFTGLLDNLKNSSTKAIRQTFSSFGNDNRAIDRLNHFYFLYDVGVLNC